MNNLSGECDFEHGMCGYTHDPRNDFDWIRNRGATTSANTGPTTDHTMRTDQGRIYLC